MVSDSPSRCGTAPPATRAASDSALAPGTVLRVPATAALRSTARAASTMPRVAVAMPEAISIISWAIFQPRCSAAAGAAASRIGAPAGSASPERAARATVQPARSSSRAASSTAAATIGPRAENAIRPGAWRRCRADGW